MTTDQLTAIRSDVEGAMRLEQHRKAGTDRAIESPYWNGVRLNIDAIESDALEVHAHAIALLAEVAASLERERVLRQALEKAFLWSMVGKPDHRENFLSYINWFNDINFVQTAIGTGRSWKDAFGDELEIAEKAKRDYEAALAKTGGV